MRELIEQRDFCGVTYRRSVFVDQDGFVIRTTEWTAISNSYNTGDVVGGVCGYNGGIIIR